MNIHWAQFTPWNSLLGGTLIGVSAAIFILVLGRVAGVAEIVARSLVISFTGKFARNERIGLAFLIGLFSAASLWRLIAPLPAITDTAGTGMCVVAGLIVGIGVRMGNGCTSGHGVCGLSRLSKRSFVNVCAFMGSGMVVVYLMKHL